MVTYCNTPRAAHQLRRAVVVALVSGQLVPVAYTVGRRMWLINKNYMACQLDVRLQKFKLF